MGNIKQLKTKQGETILPVTGENGVILTDEQGHQVGLKNYVNGKGINRNTLDPTKVLPGSDKSTIAWLNEQDEKIQQAYVAGVGGQTKATEAYNLATTAKTKAETAERLTDEAAHSAAVADKVKVAMGYAEVGDIATKTYEAGSLLFHNGKLYILNERWEDGHSWDATIVTETNVALELNKMKGVSTESVVVTISPVEAIPEDGVYVKVHNDTLNQDYDEVLFTKTENSKKVADVPLGDIYIIVAPVISGYSKSNDVKFKAEQLSRSREFVYQKAIDDKEILSVEVGTTDSALLDIEVECHIDDDVIPISIINGKSSNSITIDANKSYSLNFPTLEDYINAPSFVLKSSRGHRSIYGKYYKKSGAKLFWVTNEFQYINFDEDLSEYFKNNNIFGIATNIDSLIIDGNNCNFIIPISQFSIRKIGVAMSKQVLIGLKDYGDGLSNTKNIVDFCAENSITTGFETVYASTILDGSIHGFVMSRKQYEEIKSFYSAIKQNLVMYSVTNNIEKEYTFLSTESDISNMIGVQYSFVTAPRTLPKTGNFPIITVYPIV